MKNRQMERKQKFTLDEILPLLSGSEGEKIRIELAGENVCINSKRLRIFKSSQICHHCGLEANSFYLERQIGGKEIHPYHLGMYNVSKKGKMLFTKKNDKTTCDKCCREIFEKEKTK